MTTADRGFSLIEVTIATALMLIVMALAFGVLQPNQGAFLVEPEIADMQQRLRVAAGSIFRSLLGAGAGAAAGIDARPLGFLLPPILPYRVGPSNPDPPGTFRNDTITTVAVAPLGVSTTIAQRIDSAVSTVPLNTPAGCPSAGSGRDPTCGVRRGMTALVHDDSGSFAQFAVTAVRGSTVSLQHVRGSVWHAFDVNSRIVPIDVTTYYLRHVVATDTHQLIRYNGGASDAPVVDHVVGLTFEYWGEARPPTLIRATAAAGSRTTYGPAPPGFDSSCLFTATGSPVAAPALPVLGSGREPLVALGARELSDGPWCPDAASPYRFDADLFRIRRVTVTLRVQAAIAAFRGPAGALFRDAGRSLSPRRAPDLEIGFGVTPRNVNLSR